MRGPERPHRLLNNRASAPVAEPDSLYIQTLGEIKVVIATESADKSQHLLAVDRACERQVPTMSEHPDAERPHDASAQAIVRQTDLHGFSCAWR